MKAAMLLADAAQVADGKLYILGGGWSVTGPEPAPMALALKVEVPWDQANMRHEWMLTLSDQDGSPVFLPTPEGDHPVELGGEFEVGRPAGLAPGTPIDLPLAINLAPLPLAPGGRYCWQLAINGEADDAWQLGFTMRPAAAQQ